MAGFPVAPLADAQEGAAVVTRNAHSHGSITGRVQNVVSGQYLTNARVGVRGTTLQVFTDEMGIFRLSSVPSGQAVLQVFYTGLDDASVLVEVPSSGSVDIQVLLTRADRFGKEEAVVELDPFVISASREMNAEALSVNEQRFAPNIKNVIAADAFGDISDGNIGEFMKYMPGITADFADPDMVSISVRGLDSNLTQVTSDGARMSSAHTGGSTRVFQFNQVSINNISRLELTKVPTPADPADSLGGIVNLISKSAFERKTARLDYRLFLTGNDGNLNPKKTSDGFDLPRRRVLPSADFTYTLPLNDKLGFVISGISSDRFDERRVIARTFNATLAGSGASYSNPFLQSLTYQRMPRYTSRVSGSIKVDWRVTPNSVLSASYQHSDYDSSRAMDQLLVNVGGNALPTPASGRPLTFGPDYTYGATGRGALTMNGQYYKIIGDTDFGNVRYRFNNGVWEVKAGASKSSSSTRLTDTEHGTFYFSTVQLWSGPGFVGSLFTINLLDQAADGTGSFEVLDAQNQLVDLRDLSKYRITASSSQPRYVLDDVSTMDFSIRRNFSRLPFPAALEIGGAQRKQERDTRIEQWVWNYGGVDGIASTWESPLPYASPYSKGEVGFGISDMPWISNKAVYSAWQETPSIFLTTLAQRVTAEKYRIENSENIEETVSSGYAQLDMRLLRNRLRILTGVRFEETVGKGQGVLIEPSGIYARNPDGSFVRNAAGQQVRKPEAGAAGSMEEVSQTYFERGSKSNRSYDGYYPSAHISYNITENLIGRLAYAKTYGRPNFNQIIPRATINDFDVDDDSAPDAIFGTINIRNPALRPWTADNYDIALEYYTKQGGVYGLGAYRKEIDGFFQSVVAIATPEDIAFLGLDPRYVGYRVTTTYNLNAGSAKGLEANLRQPLDQIGAWGRNFEVFANAARFKQISGLYGQNFNAGATFRKKPFTVMAKLNHRTGSRGTKVAALGPDAYQFEGTRTVVDLSLSVALSRRLALFANGSNIFNDHPSAQRYGSETPEYAKFFRIQQFGAQYSLGIKGIF
jgi:iron complex outermembrane recepter protein